MAREISKIISEPKFTLPNVSSKKITKSFNQGDIIEFHLSDLLGNKLDFKSNFTRYTQTEDSIVIEPREILRANGYAYGQYKLQFSLYRPKIFILPNEQNPFIISEISPSRKEIKLISPDIKNGLFRTSVKTFISEL